MRKLRPQDAAITGCGAVTALGFGLDACFRALLAGRRGVRALGDARHGSARDLAAVVEPPLLRAPVPREMEPQVKFLNGAGELAVQATVEAAEAAGLAQAGVDPCMRGLYLSQMDTADWGCLEFRPAVLAATEDFARPLEPEALNRAAARRVKPFYMLESLKNNAFSFLATMFELRGGNTSVAGFAGPTLQTFDLAARSLARGSLDLACVVAAGRPTTAAARAKMALQDYVGDGGLRAPGDGAAALVLERRESAAARGAPVRALLAGQASVTRPPDGDPWAPTAAALLEAAAAALDEAGLAPGDLLGAVLPGVGEPDLGEALSALPAFASVPLVSWKARTGHMALASDAVEAALAVRALETGRLPGAHGASSGRAVLLLTAGFLGQAGALVIARP